MERVVALHEDGESVAVPFGELARERVAHVELAGREVAVFWAPGTASALDASEIAEGRDVGSSAVFEATLGDLELEFEPAGDGVFRDEQTGTLWNMSGQAVRGELEGARLVPVVHGNHFWFAWVAFRPETEVWEG